ncbi:response regulator transcription factor [Cryptosporangium arvum]|uniref:Response regulator containing a CheY-like receiver domain and an HTH DNA-binding domain n=1 Tax=Cryptosporangium arvum DSM 44712 TaxID=927661 RepID=A0A010ZRD0_9ACTN|nr:response regulator transcription factor [Cryptosporangium arvum]EXG81204.1 response regulator containing a CheY-like receiver domain and an HTH DNA-binding domain [Cryptosporangium arvum DSM 44712]
MRVVIAEDLALLRDGLVRLFTAYDDTVVAAVSSGPELLDALVEHRPDVAVVDVRLPPTFTDEGLVAAIEARRRIPGLPVLVLSQYVAQLFARELLSDGAGAVGYLLKDRVGDVTRFVESVRAVAAGGTVMDPQVIAKLLARPTHAGALGRLTPREHEVLALMAQGRNNAAIAAALTVTEKAIQKHINAIFAKLDLTSADEHRRVRAVLTFLDS